MRKIIAYSFATVFAHACLLQHTSKADAGSDHATLDSNPQTVSLATVATKDRLAAARSSEVIRKSASLAKDGESLKVGALWDSEVQASQGSVDWHMERAGVIMRSVFFAKENGDATTATKMAREALREVEAAERKIDKKDLSHAATLESVFELKALLEENFLGDTTSARREYEKRDLVRSEIAARRQAEEKTAQEEKLEGVK